MPIALGSWEPDKPDYGTDQVSDVTGCIPITGGWGPFPSLSSLSLALGGTCVGATAVLRGAGFYDLFAGTTTKLYHFNSGTNAWTDVSGPSTYAVPDGDIWQFQLFGTYLVAVNLGTKTQKFDLVSGTAFADLANAPKARFVGVAKDFLVMGCCDALEAPGANPAAAVKWCANNDFETWTVGTGYADEQVFADGGNVKGMVVSESGLIFLETQVQSMSMPGAPYVFQFDKIADNRSTRASYSICHSGTRVYVYYENGLYYWENGAEVALGSGRVNQWLINNVRPDWASRMLTFADTVNSRIYLIFRSNSEAQPHYDTILVYDYLRDRFSKIEGDWEFVFPAVTAGYTLEALDAFGTLETLPYSLDSAIWGGGTPGLGAFNTSHIFGYFASSNMMASLNTAEAMLMAPTRAFVTSSSIIGDPANVTVAIGTKETLSGTFSYGPANSIGLDNLIPARASGRYHRARVSVPAMTTWTKLQGIELNAVADGRR